VHTQKHAKKRPISAVTEERDIIIIKILFFSKCYSINRQDLTGDDDKDISATSAHFYDILSHNKTPNIYDTPTASPCTASSYTASPYDTPSMHPYEMDDFFLPIGTSPHLWDFWMTAITTFSMTTSLTTSSCTGTGNLGGITVI
jgi:hypothetical protein